MVDRVLAAARALLVKEDAGAGQLSPLPTLPPLGGGPSDGQGIAAPHRDTRIPPSPGGGRPGEWLSHWLLRLLPLLAFAGYFYFVLIEPAAPTKAITPEIEIDASSPITVPAPASGVVASAASTPVPAPIAASAPGLPSSMTALLQDWYAKLATPPTRLSGLHPAGWLLLVLGTVAIAYQVSRPRAKSLARLRTREVLREQHLHVPAVRTTRFPGSCRDEIRVASRLLRRPLSSKRTLPELVGAPLDLPATVRASANAAGRFVPVVQGRRVTPRLVVMIDRMRSDEPLTALFDRLVQALVDDGVAVKKSYFDRDLRHSLRLEAGPGDVLVLCSDGRGLIDPRLGTLFPWVTRHVAVAWPLRVLLTPMPVASWGAAEDRLAGEGGFVVLPAVSWALPALARRVVSAQDGRAEAPLELPFVAGAPARWPGLLRGQALRWVSSTAPAEEDVAALLRQLRGLLGARGFGWLAACAAYPQVSLPLAEHLAAQWDEPAGKADDDARLREAQWLALAHLPWLRQGWMPDWLRRVLLRELPAAQRERLGEALRALLRQDGTGGLDMGRIATAYQRRWFTRWLRRGEPAGSPLRDVIYLGLLDGTIDKELALGLDAKTAGRVRRKVEPAWRRPLLQGLAAVPVGAVMLWGVVLPYLWPEWVPSIHAVRSLQPIVAPASDSRSFPSQTVGDAASTRRLPVVENLSDGVSVVAPAIDSRSSQVQAAADATSARRFPAVESLPGGVSVVDAETKNPGTLHIISIGVDSYGEPALRLKYSADDAEKVAKNFEKYGKSLFHAVSPSSVLKNDKATLLDITQAFNERRMRYSPEDTLIVFLSGYGESSGGKFNFMPSDVSRFQDGTLINALDEATLFRLLDRSPQRTLLLIDVCDTGKASYSRAQVDMYQSAREIIIKGPKFPVILASRNKNLAQGACGANGVFAAALLQSLQSVRGGKEELTLHMLYSEVSENFHRMSKNLTDNQQQVMASLGGSNFPVALR